MKSELRSSVPPPSAQFVFLCGGASGKSAKRRRWRKKRAGFEEVPRLAATTVDGNRLARRWARELRPYAGVESAMHVGGGVWSPRPMGSRKCNGVWGGTMWVSPPTGVWHGSAAVEGGTRGCRPTDAWQGNSVRGREYGLPRRCAPAMTAFWRCGGYWAGRAFALAFLAFSILFSAKNPPLRGQGRVFFYTGGVRYRALTVFSLPPLKQAPMLSMTTNRPRYHATSHLWE